MKAFVCRKWMIGPMPLRAAALLLAFGMARAADPAPPAPAAAPSAEAPKPKEDYLARRKAHATELVRKAPAPDAPDPFEPTRGFKEVAYESGGAKLKAWFAMPAKPAGDKTPAVLFCHNDFAVIPEDFAACQPFLDSGRAVLIPAFRGENGNPGNFEMLYGEVEDACAAVRWLAAQAGIDAARIDAFGPGTGGAIAALLSLWDDVPLRKTGSVGGILGPGIFAATGDITPFDPSNKKEVSLRLLVTNMAFMKRPHLAYFGIQDGAAMIVPNATREMNAAKAPLKIQMVTGDGKSAFEPALKGFLEEIK